MHAEVEMEQLLVTETFEPEKDSKMMMMMMTDGVREDEEVHRHYKRRHLSLLDGLQRPWWTAAEMWAALAQGAILGARVNSQPVCNAQASLIVGVAAVMLVTSALFRPFFSTVDNTFLVVMKLLALAVAALTLACTAQNSSAPDTTTALPPTFLIRRLQLLTMLFMNHL
jgi:hypothetical protein